MERHLKERLTGATVLVLLGVIFIPMVLDNSSDSTTPARTELQDKTDNEYQSRIIPVAEHPGSDTRTDLAADNGENTAQTARQDVPSTSEPQRNIIQQSASMETDNSTIEATKLASLPEPKIQAANTQGLSGWVVQLGSFSNQTNAQGLVSSLQAQGYPAYIEELISGSESIFRVKVGPELTRENAEKTQQALIGKIGMKGIILSYP